MSTYFDIVGRAELDDAAVAALRTLPTGDWLDDGDGSEYLELVRLGGGRWSFAAVGTFRNLGRHLAADLACAGLVGEVVGEVEVVCTDGANSVARTSLRGRGRTYHAEAACLGPGTLVAHRAVPSVWDYGFATVFVLVPLAGPDQVELAPLGDGAGCACDGWDEDADEARCGASTVVTLPFDSPGAVAALDRALAGGTESVPVEPGRDAVAAVRAAAGGPAGSGPLAQWAAAVSAAGDADAAAHAAAKAGSPSTLAVDALVRRGTDRPGEPVGPDALAVLLGACRELAPATAARAAAHPSLRWPAVGEWAGAPAHRPLAANTALGDDDVLTLPAAAVADSAPWRFGDDPLVLEAVGVLAHNWPGDAASLLATVHAALADG